MWMGGNVDTKAPSQEVCEQCHRQGSLSHYVEPKPFSETTNGKKLESDGEKYINNAWAIAFGLPSK